MKTKLPKVLIVDDEADIRELLEITLGRMNLQAFSANSIAQTKTLLAEHTFNLALVDMRLPDGNGLDLIYYMQQSWPHMPVAMITAYGTMELAIEALKKGAFDFIVKPIDLNTLRNMVKSALQLSLQNTSVQHSETVILGKSKIISDLLEKVAKIARTQAPIHISGPSGSGKELVARLIHDLGPRASHRFVAVNCGAIPPELMESEFFGHKKGSFTGAINDKQGLFQAAEGGTLLLDEVGELPLNMQVKLLRVIQEKSVRAVGDVVENPVNVRILSATNQDLRSLIKEGLFREDLYYRINVIEIVLPSLNEHAEDIPLLTQHFTEKLAELNNCAVPQITSEALTVLNKYPYPGNVRELENILERAFAMCENNVITANDLQMPHSQDVSVEKDIFHWGQDNLDVYANNIEKELILKALKDAHNDKIKAANLLGLDIRAFRYKLKKLGIEPLA
jgi:two-component system response regulator PilR (NtrC family)